MGQAALRELRGTSRSCGQSVLMRHPPGWWAGTSGDSMCGGQARLGQIAGAVKTRWCQNVLGNAAMLCHLPWACRHNHPPCSPSGGWRLPLPLPSGAFTACFSEHIHLIVLHPGSQCARACVCMSLLVVARHVLGAWLRVPPRLSETSVFGAVAALCRTEQCSPGRRSHGDICVCGHSPFWQVATLLHT